MEQIKIYVNQLTTLFVLYLPKVVGAILVWLIGSWLIGRLTKLVDVAMRARDLDVSLQGFLHSLISIGLKVLLLFSIAGMLDIQTTSFIAVLGAAGLAVGLALQGSLGNFAGGVLILIFRPFKVGDIISAQGQTGEVKEIQIFNTILITTDLRTIFVPNGPLSNGVITNFSRVGKLGFEILVEVDGKHDFEKIKAEAMQVMQAESRVMNPTIGISKLGAGMVISVKGQTKPEEQESVMGLMNEKIKAVFTQNGFGGPEIHTFVHSVN